MNRDTMERLRAVATHLAPIGMDFAFLGGAILGLILDDPGAPDVRPTNDVDVLVDTRSRMEHARFEQRLRDAGFQHDTSFGAPLCRWKLGDVTVDILPVDKRILGWDSKWFAEALNHAQTIMVEDAPPLRVVTPEFFLATKLDAFQGRGECDWYGSRDLEDIVSVLDGCSDIVGRVLAAPESLRSALACSFGELLNSRSFLDALPAHLPQDPASRQRASIVLQRMRHIAGRIEAESGNA